MKSRAVVSIALAAALGVGLSACNYFAPQRTTEEYAASDGVHVDAGDYALRNLLVIAPEGAEGSDTAALVGAVVNDSGEAGSLTVRYEGGSATIELPAGETLVPLSYGEGQQVRLSGGEFIPGQNLEVTFTPAGGQSASINVPVLDGTLAEYSTLVPSASTEPAPTASATPGAANAPTETPAEGQETGAGTP